MQKGRVSPPAPDLGKAFSLQPLRCCSVWLFSHVGLLLRFRFGFVFVSGGLWNVLRSLGQVTWPGGGGLPFLLGMRLVCLRVRRTVLRV